MVQPNALLTNFEYSLTEIQHNILLTAVCDKFIAIENENSGYTHIESNWYTESNFKYLNKPVRYEGYNWRNLLPYTLTMNGKQYYGYVTELRYDTYNKCYDAIIIAISKDSSIIENIVVDAYSIM
ncbi:hypothetical protein MA9V1_071 [Chryseobacterium phage MA9V-1]|nr:hypothetical protein MA9V1_071 [Chryseobacterium phage MA9V-1]